MPGPGEKSELIRLPSTFTWKEIPVDQTEILTGGKLKQWKHLDRMSGEIGVNESTTVNLLIGANCLKAMEPQEVIPSQGNERYAIRTALGWWVVGQIDMKQSKTISCYRIVVTEASSGDTARHHFAIEDNCQEVGIQEMLKKLYMQGFVKPKITKDEICDILQEVSLLKHMILTSLISMIKLAGNHILVFPNFHFKKSYHPFYVTQRMTNYYKLSVKEKEKQFCEIVSSQKQIHN